jgi:hypothetical protein
VKRTICPLERRIHVVRFTHPTSLVYTPAQSYNKDYSSGIGENSYECDVDFPA